MCKYTDDIFKMKNQLLSTLQKNFRCCWQFAGKTIRNQRTLIWMFTFFSAMDPWRFSVIKEGRAIKLHTNWRAPAHSVSFGEFLFDFLLKSRTKIHQILTLCSLPSCQADVSWAKVQCRQVYLVVAASAHWYSGVQIIQKILQCGALVSQRCISCHVVLVLVHFNFNLVSLVQVQIGSLGDVKWWLN